MGKKSKSSNEEDKNIKIKEKKDIKKSKKTETKHELLEKNEDTERITPSVSDDNLTPIISKNKNEGLTKKKGKRKLNQSLTHNNTPNKKIIFDENSEALEVPIKIKKKKNKKSIEPKEEEPTEEEIDQFCDEVNEEDNIEYENWVQLIEAKLTSNKKEK